MSGVSQPLDGDAKLDSVFWAMETAFPRATQCLLGWHQERFTRSTALPVVPWRWCWPRTQRKLVCLRTSSSLRTPLWLLPTGLPAKGRFWLLWGTRRKIKMEMRNASAYGYLQVFTVRAFVQKLLNPVSVWRRKKFASEAFKTNFVLVCVRR